MGNSSSGLIYAPKHFQYKPIEVSFHTQDDQLWVTICTYKQITTGIRENVWQKKAIRLKFSEEHLFSLMELTGEGDPLPTINLDVPEIFDIMLA